MYDQLYQYLLQNKKLSLPGLGTFNLQREPAQSDFASKVFLPPSYSIKFDRDKDIPSKTVFIWLADHLDITEWEAIKKVNDFTFELKNKIKAGNQVKWEGVGSLSYGLGGGIEFDPGQKEWLYDEPLTAEKVVRETAEHTLRVGEQHKTSAEMAELLTYPGETQVKKSYWKTTSFVIGALLIVLIGWHFSKNGMKAGNRSKPAVKVATATYRGLQ